VATIEVKGLTKRFGHHTVVDHIDFEVSAGSVVGFLGPNGAGKTTTLRMLLGLVRASAGTATIDGRPYAQLPDPLATVGAALEASSFHPGRTARNHLRIHALAGTAGDDEVEQVLDTVDLREAADQRVGEFSLGMRQRLGLATALLHDPKVLILDEPANGLDPEGVRWLRDLLRARAGTGCTVLVSSHILAEVAQTVDSVVILDRGRLVAHSTLDDIRAQASQSVHIRTPDPIGLVDVLSRLDGVATSLDRDWVTVTGASTEAIGLLAAEQSIPIFEATTQPVTLESVFFELTRNSSQETGT
jgi:ABC-2 type transport system ATP-binding protein